MERVHHVRHDSDRERPAAEERPPRLDRGCLGRGGGVAAPRKELALAPLRRQRGLPREGGGGDRAILPWRGRGLDAHGDNASSIRTRFEFKIQIWKNRLHHLSISAEIYTQGFCPNGPLGILRYETALEFTDRYIFAVTDGFDVPVFDKVS